MPESVAPGREDRIGALPDDLLRRVLSFLTSRESVCTCVLARRWRHLWKSVPVVRVMAPVPFDREVDIGTYLHEPSAPLSVELWLQYAASCHVRVLRVWVLRVYSRRLQLPNHLTVLDFAGVKFEECTLNFSSCPMLEKILCKSLRHLTMEICRFDRYGRTRISCPSLTALKLVDNLGWTPSLESMPLLVTALIRFDEEWYDLEASYDHCPNGGYYEDCDDEFCPSCLCQGDDCVLLKGLCNATNLKLTKFNPLHFIQTICTRDFKWRHTFSKLKTLFLNDWCLTADFGGLVYFLQHSPILERLTLQLRFREQQSMDGKDESYKPRKHFLVSKNLKVVEMKCHKEDERIHQIVKILISLGVPPEHIDNQQNDVWSDCSSFEQDYFQLAYGFLV
ncbi:hypothetical protein VPH35_008579 [Triticum aestivum]